MSEIKVVRRPRRSSVRSGPRSRRAPRRGSCSRDDADVIAARVERRSCKDLAHELADGDEVEAVADRQRRTAATSCATRPRTCWRRPCRSCSPTPSSASARRSRTASTTTSTSRPRSSPRTSRSIETADAQDHQGGPAVRRAGSITDADALDELKDEPYKLELIGLKGSGNADDAAEGASVEVGAGELTIYDNVDRNGEVALERPVPRPAPADHQADPGRSS